MLLLCLMATRADIINHHGCNKLEFKLPLGLAFHEQNTILGVKWFWCIFQLTAFNSPKSCTAIFKRSFKRRRKVLKSEAPLYQQNRVLKSTLLHLIFVQVFLSFTLRSLLEHRKFHLKLEHKEWNIVLFTLKLKIMEKLCLMENEIDFVAH